MRRSHLIIIAVAVLAAIVGGTLIYYHHQRQEIAHACAAAMDRHEEAAQEHEGLCSEASEVLAGFAGDEVTAGFAASDSGHRAVRELENAREEGAALAGSTLPCGSLLDAEKITERAEDLVASNERLTDAIAAVTQAGEQFRANSVCARAERDLDEAEEEIADLAAQAEESIGAAEDTAGFADTDEGVRLLASLKGELNALDEDSERPSCESKEDVSTLDTRRDLLVASADKIRIFTEDLEEGLEEYVAAEAARQAEIERQAELERPAWQPADEPPSPAYTTPSEDPLPSQDEPPPAEELPPTEEPSVQFTPDPNFTVEPAVIPDERTADIALVAWSCGGSDMVVYRFSKNWTVESATADAEARGCDSYGPGPS